MLERAARGAVSVAARRGELAILVAAAFLIRFSLLALRGDYLDWDEALYLLMARNILDGAGISVNGLPHIALSPLVSLTAAATSAATGLSLLIAQRFVVSLAGALLVIPVSYLLKLCAGQRVASIGSILIVGWMALIDVGPRFGPMWRHVYAGSEPLYLTLLFAAFAMGELALRRRRRVRLASLIAAGAFLALAYLTRPEAIVIGGLYAIIRGLLLLRQGRASDALVALGVTAAAFAIVAGPYVLHMKQLAGAWTLSGKLGATRITADLYQEVVRNDARMGPYLKAWWALDDGHGRMVNPYWGVDGSEPLSLRLDEYRAVLASTWTADSTGVKRAFDRARGYVAALWALCLPLFLPLALAGVLWRKGELAQRFPPFVLAAIIAGILTSWQVFVLPRFFLYLVPAFALWTARGVILVSGLRWPRQIRDPKRAVIFVLIASSVGLAALRALGSEAKLVRDAGDRDRAAAERLAEVVTPTDAVMSWHPRLAYWGGWDWRAMPVASLDAVIHYAAHRRLGTLFLARGGYSPLALEADYVVITLDPALAAAYRALGSGEAEHSHPPATLLSVDEVAGFPAGRIVLGNGAGGGGPE